jgi:hypothetical protein
MSPEVYRLLTTDRRWTPVRYSTWLAETLEQQLLTPPSARSGVEP